MMHVTFGNMEERYVLLRHLYEDPPDHERLRELLRDEDLRGEWEALLATKQALDALPKRRPKAATIDAIAMAAARRPTSLRLVRPRMRLVWGLSAVAAAALIVALGVFQREEPEETAAVALEDTVRAEPPAEEAVPVWDESEDIVDMHRRLTMLRARSTERLWDESAVMSLDSMPLDPTGIFGNLETASTRKER